MRPGERRQIYLAVFLGLSTVPITPTTSCGRLQEKHYRWRPSIHMPKEAARIFLQVKDVRVERLQDINLDPPGPKNQVIQEGLHYLCDFIAVWNRAIKPEERNRYGWYANPWVWVIEFERCRQPEGWPG